MMSSQSTLIDEARARFGGLSAAEENVINAVLGGDVAYCGPNNKDDLPENDPAGGAEWGEDRRIRPQLIRWLCVDPNARAQIDPHGIQVCGATIGNSATDSQFDLSALEVPFRVCFRRCNFEATPVFVDARILGLSLEASRIPGLMADRLHTVGDMALNGVHADGEIRLVAARVGGDFSCDGAQFGDTSKVNLEGATIAGAFIWTNIGTASAVHLNLDEAQVGRIIDDEKSWPKKGNLRLNGLVYQKIAAEKVDASKRLEWLSRQPDGFTPQPFTQLAKVLRANGDDSGMREVLIAREDARMEHGKLGRVQRALGWLLRVTVGYGYRPYRALGWMLGFVLLGSLLFSWGYDARVIMPIEKKTPPQFAFDPLIYSVDNFLPFVDLSLAKHWLPNPIAKPIGLALPGTDTPIQNPASLGSFIRWYLWAHILLGWFFTSMFVAAVTGLIRRE